MVQYQKSTSERKHASLFGNTSSQLDNTYTCLNKTTKVISKQPLLSSDIKTKDPVKTKLNITVD